MSAIDPRLLQHYNRELLYLRRHAAEFGAEHPQVAARLGLDAPTDPDPHVERLLEGVAYLNARVQLKLDDQFPVFTQYLLDALYPHYLAPTPAMAIVALEPNDGDDILKEGPTHKRGTEIQATLTGDRHSPVTFRTGMDVTLWPLAITAVDYLPTRAAVANAAAGAPGDAALRIRLSVTGAMALAELPIDQLPIFLDGGPDAPNLLYQQLLNDCCGVRLASPDRGRRDFWTVPGGAVEPVGFGSDEALLPGDSRSFRGYRLLSEYFALPEKFRFIRLTGLKAGLSRAEKEVDVVILLRRAVPALAQQVGVDMLRLYATPVVNLFERRFDRTPVERGRDEHLVLPERTNVYDYEVYQLKEVTAYPEGDAFGVPVQPLYARSVERGVEPLFYALRRQLRRLPTAEMQRRRENDYIGSEVWISLTAPDNPRLAQSVRELGVRGLVTNRALSTRLRPGSVNLELRLTDMTGVQAARILLGPTRPHPPMGLGDGAWRVVSHLAPGHNGFVGADGAPDLLADHLSLYLRDEAPALRREIQGIVGLTSENVTRRAHGHARVAFQRGQKLTLALAMASFDAGTAYLFTSVVAAFLAEFATINSFAMTEVKADNGLTWGWRECPGQRPTI